MLLGTFAPKLDEKNRIVLPAKFWDEFSGGLVMTRGLEHSVFLYSAREFETLHEQLREASLTSRKARDFMRVFLSGASQELPDKQRRITVPPLLRDYAGLTRDLTVIGAGPRAEIWETSAWNRYLADTESAFSDTDEEVIPGLF
ncbi:MAG: division/cell wall cluster transcriptional repressor MraZ [Micrococcales bacterium]|nr:division/cell wall cluster transcriptional repressor MraZ [Micrococcales bacterium]